MPGYSKNLNLILPNKNENYNIEVANTNNNIIDTELNSKVSKIVGKDLSTNDFTNEYKKKIDSLQTLYRFKGNVETLNELNTKTDNNIGDVWNCKENSNNYCWNKEEWVNIGQYLDYSEILDSIDELQTNIEEEINNSSIVVSATEPTVNRKKVWMQKGKNLFNKNNVIRKDNYILNDSGVETADSTGGYTKMYIPVKPNTVYTISGLETGGTKRIYFFDKNKNFISRTAGLGSPETITTPNNCYYVDFQYYINNVNFDTYQLEQGSTATPYEAYIEQKIYILNDNNVYEEFMKREENINLASEITQLNTNLKVNDATVQQIIKNSSDLVTINMNFKLINDFTITTNTTIFQLPQEVIPSKYIAMNTSVGSGFITPFGEVRANFNGTIKKDNEFIINISYYC